METTVLKPSKGLFTIQGSGRVNRQKSLSKLEKEGIIQRFEYTFELSWKTLKDYLEAQGEKARFPRDVIKKAFQYEMIDNGTVWMQMLESRNILSHPYDEQAFETVFTKIIQEYFQAITSAFQEMERLYEGD
ncbi:nucleotidyltransferase substrate binding protein [Alkalihalobacillus oceani]|uniref:Nucleotidyltransferase substrate binding protein n=1 Tax=Halalkalibacter oceani TaxID=1653776 RepID=A0A9X2DS48_9BACI|nr:nucleotidyltransferase substrate binding protein [Halalkalibacter oceani]MCM3714432.1 nucleotidyltransferase substrate binding protein [Halalkalibacter oceani]